MGNLMQDIRFAMRQLSKTPGFTATAVLTLALGIGANAAIFTLVNAVLLKDLPVANPQQLVRLGDRSDCCVNRGPHDDGDFSLFSTAHYEQFKKAPEFEELAAMQSGYGSAIVRRDGNNEIAHTVDAEFVSGNYFQTFGLTPSTGRLLRPSDDVAGGPVTAVMSYSTWDNDYNRDPSVVGATFWINTKPVTVVGIAPEQFYGDRLTSTPPRFFLPLEAVAALAGGSEYVHDPAAEWLYVIGRVKPGTALAPLGQKLAVQLKQMESETKNYAAAHDRPLLDKIYIPMTPGGAGVQQMQTAYKSNLQLLQWIAGLVLLIACANIANLLLVRGMSRKAEMSVRTALGAARGRLIRQLMTESTVLALLGGVAALAVSYGGAQLLLKLAFPRSTEVPIHASPSLEVMGFALGLSLLTGILFGVAPAWLSAKAQPADALRSGTRTSTGGASLLQRTLVVLQAALSLVLLVGAGMFAKSLSKLEHIDLKLNSTNRYIVHFDPRGAGYLPSQVGALYQTIEERFHQVPGMVKVGITSSTPMETFFNNDGVQIEGKPDMHRSATTVRANEEYFDSVGTHVVMGRGIGPQDTFTSPMVAVVNQSFVKTFFAPGENPIGHRLGDPGPTSSGAALIVGVVEDTAYTSVRNRGREMYFIPMMQHSASDPRPVDKMGMLYMGAIVLETARPMDNMEALTRQTLSSINPNLSVVRFQTFDAQIAGKFTHERMLSRLMTLFGALALLLASVGLYGVTAYGVARRTSEIGVRMALGAERSSVIAMVMRSAMTQVLIGLAIGIPVAWYSVQFISSQLYDMKSLNVESLLIAVGVLSVAACVAGLIPAQRAASIEPVVALRSE